MAVYEKEAIRNFGCIKEKRNNIDNQINNSNFTFKVFFAFAKIQSHI